MCKLTDNYFFENGYWKHGDEVTVVVTEKWRKLIDTAFRNTPRGFIITEDVLIKTMAGKTKRTPYAVSPSNYVKKKDRVNDNQFAK